MISVLSEKMHTSSEIRIWLILREKKIGHTDDLYVLK